MRRLTLVVAAVLGTAGLIQTQALAQDACGRLWYQRNAIYKDAGYCFHTGRGIRAFGNAGCQYDDEADVPLSRGERRQVAGLQAREEQYGCRD